MKKEKTIKNITKDITAIKINSKNIPSNPAFPVVYGSHINLSLTKMGQSLVGLGAIMNQPIKGIKIEILSGDVGYIDIEFCGDFNKIKNKFPKTLKQVAIMSSKSDFSSYIIRCYLTSISLEATAPQIYEE